MKGGENIKGEHRSPYECLIFQFNKNVPLGMIGK